MSAHPDGAPNAEAAAAIEPHKTFDTILVLDFGSQYSHLITRRLRELHIYSEMLPCDYDLSTLSWKPKGIILSGGPYSVYEEGAPHASEKIYDMGIPILGICYGLQEMAWHFGKNVLAGEKREFGQANLKVEAHDGNVSALFSGVPSDGMTVWMSHGDKLSHLPDDFQTIASTPNAPFAGIAHKSKPFYGIQFHPEVTHTPQGTVLLGNFAATICGAQQNWTMAKFVDQEIARIRALVGDKGQVIGAVSGGVDSTVTAKLMDRAIGSRFHAVFINGGILRENEAAEVETTLKAGLEINLHVVDKTDAFLSALKGVTDGEQKRKIIGAQFISAFKEKSQAIVEEAKNTPNAGSIDFLAQGTLYPDVIESLSFKGPSGK